MACCSATKPLSSSFTPPSVSPPQMNADLFGGGDAVVKYVLEVRHGSLYQELPRKHPLT